MAVSFKDVVSPLSSWLRETPTYFLEPVRFFRGYQWNNVRPDLIAGLTVAVVLLPQAIAYASIAELPASVGLYSAVIAGIVAALWGASSHLQTGPTNAASLLVLATLLGVAEPGTEQFMIAAGVMAFTAGVIKLCLGLLRIGLLVYFVSDSVIIGFTAGAGVLISVSQLRPILNVDVPRSPYLIPTVMGVIDKIGEVHYLSLLVGGLTILLLVGMKRYRPKWPATIIALIVMSIVVAAFGLTGRGVAVLGEVPRQLPTIRQLPLTDIDLLDGLGAGVIAAAIISLVEAMSIARAFAGQSGERININQEFVGQGLADMFTGLFGGYSSSGSFTRSAINYEAGGQTRMASIVAALIVLAASLLFAPLIGFLPQAAIAGVIMVTGFSMIDRDEIGRIFQSSVGDTRILLATFIGVLVLRLQYAVLLGVIASFIRYIYRTSHPNVPSVLPDENFAHFEHRPDQPNCLQLGVLTIGGSLYFGATHHVEEQIRKHLGKNSEQKFLLFRMHHVNHIDMTGIHMLESIVRLQRQKGGDVFMMRVHTPVLERMEQTGFSHLLGLDHFLAPESGISYLFNRVLDPAICIYSCEVKAWRECQTLPKSHNPDFVPLYALEDANKRVPSVSASDLWKRMSADEPLLVIDVRESAEWERDGFIPGSQFVPLPRFFGRNFNLPPNSDIIFISRTGRRSRHLVSLFNRQGWQNVYNLRGGILEWRANYLPIETVILPPENTDL